MSGFDIIILIMAIVIIAAVVGAFVTKEQKSLEEMTEKYYVNDKLEELPKEKLNQRKKENIIQRKNNINLSYA